ncbi:hypothetical protein ACA086_06000 [Muriicola sp. E247]|uniref:hypothetical protein n=1 Tax=Muriicola sp. E247 TaxID=3242730 RepID=UPI003526BB62
MKDILELARIQIGLITAFILLKLIRPSVLQSNSPEWMKITLLSAPNFFEAVIGILILTGIGLYFNLKVPTDKWRIKRNLLYIMALVVGGIYVITQELKIHNFGGNNVFDKNDVIFSVIGLVVGFLIVIIKKPQIYPNTKDEII